MSPKYVLHRLATLLCLLVLFSLAWSEQATVLADSIPVSATPTQVESNHFPGAANPIVPAKTQSSRLTPLRAAVNPVSHATPGRPALQLAPSAPKAKAAADSSCYEYFGNNGFETYEYWLRYNEDADNVFYSNDYWSRGSQSIYFNNRNKEANRYVDIWQPIAQIPNNATSIYIEFDSFIRYDDITDGDEAVYFGIWDEDGELIVWEQLNYPCNCEWFYFEASLPVADLRGLSGLEVGFSLESGSNQYYSEVYFDEAYLTVCVDDTAPTATPTRLPPSPTSTPPLPTTTPTATATPTQKPPTPTPTLTPTPDVPGDQFEADDQCSQASKIANDGVFQSHTFHKAADADWISFQVNKDATYVINADPPEDSEADMGAELYADCDANANAEHDLNLAAPGLQLEFTSPKNGTVYVKLFNNDASKGGTNYRYNVSVRQLPNQASDSALILVAGTLGPSDVALSNIFYVTNQVRQVFLNNGYSDDRILYLAPNTTQGQQLPGVDQPATAANFEAALHTFAPNTISQNGALTIYFMDHGAKSKIYLDKSQNETITPAQLNGWLTQLETARPDIKINIIIEACYAGSFINAASSISKANRVVIASTNADTSAWALKDAGAVFSDQLLDALNHKASLHSAFLQGNDAAKALKRGQEPWLDSNGDGIPNQSADFAIAAQRGFGIPGTLAASEWAPYVETILSPAFAEIKAGTGQIRADVRDDGSIQEVWAIIYPPSYQPPTDNESLVVDSIQPLVLPHESGHLFSAPYSFTEAGVYHIVISAKDDQGLVAPLKSIDVDTSIALSPNAAALFLPLLQR